MKVYRLAHELALRRGAPFRPAPTDNRWNTERTVVAYASDSLALAAWEILTYWAHYDSLEGYRIFTYDLSAGDVEDSAGQVESILGDRQLTQRYGDDWVRQHRSLALRVPSLRLPESFNFLINPQHPAFSEEQVTALGSLVLDEQVRLLLHSTKPQP